MLFHMLLSLFQIKIHVPFQVCQIKKKKTQPKKFLPVLTQTMTIRLSQKKPKFSKKIFLPVKFAASKLKSAATGSTFLSLVTKIIHKITYLLNIFDDIII